MSYTMARHATARYAVKEAREATWARRIALFFVQLLILTALLHHFGSLTTPAAINLLGVSIAGMLLAIAVAVASLVRIWFGGQTGGAQAFAAIFIACLGLAVPGFYLSHAVTLPRLTSVETSPDEPLQFNTLASMRPADANPIPVPDDVAIEAQEEAYPDIAPISLERSAAEVFSLVHEAVERLGWTIVTSEAPGETGPGRIEATDRTLVMGFTDDVVVQIKGDDTHAIINARSASRYGLHDLGTNAARVRGLFAEITTALEKGEKTVLEQAAPKEEEAEKKATTKKPAKKKTGRKKRSRSR
ncbi:MAG TPA: DUF1499 domain-containing protein [Methyloceanibacter sp.]|nr:DUF1499 domain-containing protein [Methyloceanibacter sp.]